jgi:integrase
MVTVAALTGLRSRELRGLIWTDVDLKAGKLTVQKQIDHEDRGTRVALKTPAARRTRPLPPAVVDALRDLHAHRAEWGDTDGFVFQRDGRPVAHGQLADDFKAAVKAAAIDDHDKRLTPHSLRHGYGSLLIATQRGRRPGVPCEGPRLRGITLRVYSHEFESARPEADEKALAAIEAFTSPA